MSDRTFIDTDVLIYAYEADAKAKHETAKRLLLELRGGRTGVLSMQVLQEFSVHATRKFARPLSRVSARLVVRSYMIWCVHTTPAEISAAFRIADESRIEFWDALIVASPLKSGAQCILSEDLNPGRRIAGIRIKNPFD